MRELLAAWLISRAFSLSPTNEASQVNHSSYQREQCKSRLAIACRHCPFPKREKIAFHRSDLISIINSCLSLELQERIQCNGRQRLGRNYQFRNKASQCSGRERAREGNEANTWTGPPRPEHTSGTRAQLAFVVWLCRSS
jgi:hypothetical protein